MASIIFLSLLFLSCQTIPSTEANQQIWKASATAKIKGPTADQVWPYIAGFCNIHKILPTDISFCVQTSDGQPGQIRYGGGMYPSMSIANTTVVLWVREELLEIDANKKYLTYQIHENNRGYNELIGTMQVLPDEDSGSGCIFKWSVSTPPFAGLTYRGLVHFLHEHIGVIVALIEKLF